MLEPSAVLEATAFIVGGCLVALSMASATFVFAHGARAWSLAITAQHNARGMKAQADEAQAVAEEAKSLADKAHVGAENARNARKWRPVTEEEIEDFVRSERDTPSTNGAAPRRVSHEEDMENDVTGTLENEGFDLPDAGMPGGFYADPPKP